MKLRAFLAAPLTLALVLLVGCGAEPTLTSIQVIPGTTTTPVGQTVQFQAIGTYHKSNQSTPSKDITSQVTWRTSDPSIATITPAGLATGTGLGIATITATLNGVTGTSTLNSAGSALPMLTITNVGLGSGVVTSSPGPINCGAVCTGFFTVGQKVTLTAAPNPGSTFGGWSVNCQPVLANSCTLTMTSNETVSAIFN